MFGYVVIDKPNILIKDYNTYRSYYCGLCKSLGKNYGQLMRLTVNYDIVLLSLLVHNYESVCPTFSQERCILHPIGKRVPIARSVDIFKRITEANVILGYYKVLDNVLDDGKNRLIKFFLKRKFKKAQKNHKEFCKVVDYEYNRLRDYEKHNCREIELLADCFGKIMVSLINTVSKKVDDTLISLCYNLGKWIYYIDAYDDITEDFTDRKFNPFTIDTEHIGDQFYDTIDKNARHLLYSAIDNIINAYDKMNITVSEGVLSNIIYLGLKSRTEMVLKRRGIKCKKIRL